MKKNKRYLSIFMALALVFSCAFPTTSFASDAVETEETEIQGNSFVQIQRDEAAKILNVSVQELGDDECYLYQGEMTPDAVAKAASHVTIYPGQTHIFPSFTFTYTNTGQWWTCQGTKIKVYISNTGGTANIDFTLQPYGTLEPESPIYFQEVPVKSSYTSPWVSAKKGLDYRMVYYNGWSSTVAVGISVQ